MKYAWKNMRIKFRDSVLFASNLKLVQCSEYSTKYKNIKTGKKDKRGIEMEKKQKKILERWKRENQKLESRNEKDNEMQISEEVTIGTQLPTLAIYVPTVNGKIF